MHHKYLTRQIYKTGNNSNDQGTITGTAISPNLHLLTLENSQYITLSDTSQHSTRMIYYFLHQCNCFLGYFNDPVPNGAVIYTGENLFQYSKQEGTYTEVSDNPSGKCLPVYKQGPFIFY